MIYPNKPLYLLSLLGYIYCLTYYTLTTKDNILFFPFLFVGTELLILFLQQLQSLQSILSQKLLSLGKIILLVESVVEPQKLLFAVVS